jgi:hypothetical protein
MTACLPRILLLACFAAAPAALARADDQASDPTLHPLQHAVQYATSHAAYIRQHVHDYTCQLVKRERIDGDLQAYRLADVKVLCGHRSQGRTSVLMEFKAPKSHRGRTVLFVEGQNDGKVLVRKGGSGMFRGVELELNPHGPVAQRESNYPISEIGFDRIMDRLIQLIKDDIERDPAAANTKVSYFRKAKVKDRICTHVQVVHPRKSTGLQFHQASLFIDDELHVPIRLVVYGWRSAKEEKLPLLEEYNYVNLRLNVGLTNDLFAKSRYFAGNE